MGTAAAAVAAAAKSLQSCPTLCDSVDGSPPGSSVPGILQARTLEWVAISFSNAWKWKVKVKSVSCVWPSATPWTAFYQAPPSLGFSRQLENRLPRGCQEVAIAFSIVSPSLGKWGISGKSDSSTCQGVGWFGKGRGWMDWRISVEWHWLIARTSSFSLFFLLSFWNGS